MVLRKSDIVRSVTDFPRPDGAVDPRQRLLFPELKIERLGRASAARIVDSLFETIKSTLERGETVRIIGFGKFEVRFKWARRGRNPATGEPMMLKPRKVVVFRPSRLLRDKLNKKV